MNPRLSAWLLRLAPAVLLAACQGFRADQLMHKAAEFGAQGRWDEALHYYERLWVQFPENPRADEARLQAARIFAGPAQKMRSAEQLYRYVAIEGRSEESRAQAVLGLINLYAADEQLDERAIEVLEAARKRFPGDSRRPEIALRLADLYLRSGRWAQAFSEVQDLRRSDDRGVQVRAYLISGESREMAKLPAEALSDYRAAAALTVQGSADWIAAREGIARTLEETGKAGDALEILADLRDHHPNPDAVERWIAAIEARQRESMR